MEINVDGSTMVDESTMVDTSWMDNFEKGDVKYAPFYLNDVLSINIVCLYIDNENQIETYKEHIFLFREKNKLSKEELLGILKQNSFLHNKKYSLLSMFKYNISLQPEEVSRFLTRDESFVSVVKNIDDIGWNKTISMFHDLNQLIILFHNVSSREKAMVNANTSINKNALTKKIILSSMKRKKTRRFL
jgi:hypothetical protein